jgi:hypothetical protein
MKRHFVTIVLAASAVLAATPLLAQAPAPTPQPAQQATANWFAGDATLQLLGREDVDSSKFEEYRIVPKGVSMPVFNLQGSRNGNNYALFGKNIYQDDQRYSGWANTDWLGVRFDYNQVPHSMGLDAKTIHTEAGPGIWRMNATTRKALGDAVDAVPAANRSYPFYLDLLGPTMAAAEHSDLKALRQRGDVVVDVGKKLPFDLAFTYNNDQKTGYRGASAGDILGVVTASVDVLEPLDEVTQDYGIRWSWKMQQRGDVHATFNYNIYDDKIDQLIVDNPFRATDLAYVSTSVPGGPAQARFSTAPDNEAMRGGFGAQFKFARQTRITADLAYGQWTQNAAFLPYTINSAIVTPGGAPANAVSSLQQASLDGRIDTASYNFTFFSRPADRVSVRMRYRNYAYKDKSARFVIAGDTSGSPDRSWGAANAPTAEEPYGHATANRTDSSIGQFEAQASYDFGDLTVEGAYRNTQTAWEGRVESSGTDGSENTYIAAAVYHGRDWLDFRAHFDTANRTVSGIEAGSVAAVQGVMADHAERDQTRIGADIELMPNDKYGVTFGYNRRSDDYPNRPFKVAGDARTESGLLEASYNMYSVDFTATPGARAELTMFYSYEKVAEVNQWVTLTSGAVNNLLTYAPWDKSNTVGINGNFDLVPDKWKVRVLAQYQKVDGFLDITALESGSFYTPGRTTLIPTGQGGAADINDYDDTMWTQVAASVDYTLKAWTWSTGYAFDKYTNADAFSDGTTIFPQAVLFFLKANDGNYKTNMLFTRLTYRF